jgi:hypothetical protein
MDMQVVWAALTGAGAVGVLALLGMAMRLEEGWRARRVQLLDEPWEQGAAGRSRRRWGL